MDSGVLPLGLWPTAVLAALPVLTVFVLLGPLRVASYRAALVGLGVAALLAVGLWRLPLTATLAAGAYGMATGLYPIIYIIFGSLMLYNLTVVTGWAADLRAALGRLVPDPHLLLLLIGFGFAAFLDSTAGFLTPVTVATALLVGVGVPAFTAAAYTLVATALPPVFGAMAIPVVVLAETSGQPLVPLAQHQAAVTAVLSLAFPLWLTATFGGWRTLRRLAAPALAAGGAYALTLWWVATRISPYPAAVCAAAAALLATGVAAWLQGHRPVQRGAGPGAAPGTGRATAPDPARVAAPGPARAAAPGPVPAAGRILPWWPYLVLMVTVTLWSLPAVGRWLEPATALLPIPGLPGAVRWRFDLLASPGTAIVVSALVFGLGARVAPGQWREAIGTTARQLRYPLINMMAMFALAQIMNFSGMTPALGMAVAGAGPAFPVLSPYLSWLGAAITGSNTAANAMLGGLQALTAAQLGLDPLVVVSLAGAAAPLGKMVAPQVLSAAAGAGNIPGAEGKLLRVGLWHSLVWTGFVALGGWILTR